MTIARTSSLAIAGVGNLLCSDDGLGIHAVSMLRADPIPGVDILDLGTAILHAVDCLAGAKRVLVLDAVNGGCPPGTLYCFDADYLPRGLGQRSVHALGLSDAFSLLRPDRRPRLTVLGIEPASLAYGMDLTPAVEAQMPRLVAETRAIARQWVDEEAFFHRAGRTVNAARLILTA
jgi:hydrogenase maturation protease